MHNPLHKLRIVHMKVVTCTLSNSKRTTWRCMVQGRKPLEGQKHKRYNFADLAGVHDEPGMIYCIHCDVLSAMKQYKAKGCDYTGRENGGNIQMYGCCHSRSYVGSTPAEYIWREDITMCFIL